MVLPTIARIDACFANGDWWFWWDLPQYREFRDKQKYWEVFRDMSNYFHGVDFDINRILKMLESWVLPRNQIWQKMSNENAIGENWDTTVSMSQVPVLQKNRKNELGWSLLRYTLSSNSVSFVCENITKVKGKWWSMDSSNFWDECFVSFVLPSQIKGLIINRDKFDEQIINEQWEQETYWNFFKRVAKEKNLKLYDKKWFEIVLDV